MWVFLNNAFLSIIASDRDKESVIVRARFKGDLEATFGKRLKVYETPDRDYRFRAKIKRATVAQRMAREVIGLTYGNFKSSVKDNGRHTDYLRVWTVMNAAQERRTPRPRAKGARGWFDGDEPEDTTGLPVR